KCETWPPPPLLNLEPLYFPTDAQIEDALEADPQNVAAQNAAAQKASLKKLQEQAIANVIRNHSLTAADSIAVQTWGRDDALAELFFLLTQAITADTRTPDQQNVVDWLSGIMKQRAIAAAENAGREYVKWAGLNMGAYETL